MLQKHLALKSPSNRSPSFPNEGEMVWSFLTPLLCTTRCYAFNRDGRFLCEIGRVGQGPGEYQSIMGLFVDEKKQLLYIETPSTLLAYSWTGFFRRSIRKPQNMNELPLREVALVHDNLFIGHSTNYAGNEMYSFLLFSDSARVKL